MLPHLCSLTLELSNRSSRDEVLKKKPMMAMAWGEAASDRISEGTSDQR
jgi:hypothetical protein